MKSFAFKSTFLKENYKDYNVTMFQKIRNKLYRLIK